MFPLPTNPAVLHGRCNIHFSTHGLLQVAEIEKQLEAKEVLLLQRRLEKLGTRKVWANTAHDVDMHPQNVVDRSREDPKSIDIDIVFVGPIS